MKYKWKTGDKLKVISPVGELIDCEIVTAENDVSTDEGSRAIVMVILPNGEESSFWCPYRFELVKGVNRQLEFYMKL